MTSSCFLSCSVESASTYWGHTFTVTKTPCMWFCAVFMCTVCMCYSLHIAVCVFSVWTVSLTCFLRASNAALMVWTRVLSRALASSLLVCWMALTSGRRPGPSAFTPTRFLGDSWETADKTGSVWSKVSRYQVDYYWICPLEQRVSPT